MIVYDPLYGQFEVPDYLADLILTPEVRRLSQIRLLNSLTPTLAALGEVRRYSHTLGVIYLAQQLSYVGFSNEEQRALAAAVLVHDIGTPPFGHVMEYHLTERKRWNHESIIRDILLGTQAPENRAHQIFAGITIDFKTRLRHSGIFLETVIAIVEKRHPMSRLLFGTLDLDNLDNVVRMGWFLGIGGCAELSVSVARQLGVTADQKLLLPDTMRGVVQQWLDLRRRVYETLLFDPYSIASQAVLWNAIGMAFEEGVLSEVDWDFTDEQLLELLRQHPLTKEAITVDYLGTPPNLALCVQFRGSLSDLGFRTRTEASRAIEEVLRTIFATGRVLGYVQIDSGTFEKEIEFVTASGTAWRVGKRSESVIVYGFVRQHISSSQCARAFRLVLDRFAVPSDRILRSHLDLPWADAQPAFNFSPAKS